MASEFVDYTLSVFVRVMTIFVDSVFFLSFFLELFLLHQAIGFFFLVLLLEHSLLSTDYWLQASRSRVHTCPLSVDAGYYIYLIGAFLAASSVRSEMKRNSGYEHQTSIN